MKVKRISHERVLLMRVCSMHGFACSSVQVAREVKRMRTMDEMGYEDSGLHGGRNGKNLRSLAICCNELLRIRGGENHA